MADILIVEDDDDLVDVFAEFLRLEGHEVRVAHNGQDGLDRLAERTPDLVVVDIHMPVLDGPAMAYRMFVQDVGMERIPIVLLSGNANLDEIAARIGTLYSLAKPIAPDDLLAMLRRALVERTPPSPSFLMPPAPA